MFAFLKIGEAILRQLHDRRSESSSRCTPLKSLKSGAWQYDGCVLHEVWIVKQNLDFYYDEGFADAPEDLNENGLNVARLTIAKSCFHTGQDRIVLERRSLVTANRSTERPMCTRDL